MKTHLNVEIKTSLIVDGFGLFAKKDFKKGETI